MLPRFGIACLRPLADEPPVNLSDGGAIRAGFDSPPGRAARSFSQNSKTFLARIEQRERDRTGIASLKIRFNNVFGYYIEISKANMHLAPADYERKQTLVNAERFTTPELKELEVKILEAEERMLDHRARNLRTASSVGLLGSRAHQGHSSSDRRAGRDRRSRRSRRRAALRSAALRFRWRDESGRRRAIP